MDYLYLHGFASGPQSAKAQFLQRQFADIGISLHVLDLNQNDFSHLTLSRQIQQGVAWARERDRVTIIGSSLGGLTAAWIAEQPTMQTKVSRLVLLAPAFEFLAQWLPRLGEATVNRWQVDQWLSVYHYGAQGPLPLAYDFVTDARRYHDADLRVPIPTLILHGRNDEVIPIQASTDYAAERPWVTLRILSSDHSLNTVHTEIWEMIQAFLELA